MFDYNKEENRRRIARYNKVARKLKNIRHISIAVVATVFMLIILCNCIYTLDVEHSAVVTTFGKAEVVTESGPHFKLPFIQKKKKVDMTIQGMAIGYDIATNKDVLSESIMISSDYNFLNVDFYLEYQVSDPLKYLYASNDPKKILRSMAQEAIRTTIASYKADAILTTGKSEIQSNIKTLLMEWTDSLDIGISIKSVSIQDSDPPTDEVKQAFQAVEDAKQGKETALNEANKYRNEQIPKAEAEVDKIIQNAEAVKNKRISEAEGQVARFNAMYEEYVKFPSVTKERMFYEAMEDILPNMKIVISESGNDIQTFYPLEKFSE